MPPPADAPDAGSGSRKRLRHAGGARADATGLPEQASGAGGEAEVAMLDEELSWLEGDLWPWQVKGLASFYKAINQTNPSIPQGRPFDIGADAHRRCLETVVRMVDDHRAVSQTVAQSLRLASRWTVAALAALCIAEVLQAATEQATPEIVQRVFGCMNETALFRRLSDMFLDQISKAQLAQSLDSGGVHTSNESRKKQRSAQEYTHEFGMSRRIGGMALLAVLCRQSGKACKRIVSQKDFLHGLCQHLKSATANPKHPLPEKKPLLELTRVLGQEGGTAVVQNLLNAGLYLQVAKLKTHRSKRNYKMDGHQLEADAQLGHLIRMILSHECGSAVCGECGFKCDSLEAFINHQRQSHATAATPKQPVETKPVKGAPLTCPSCGCTKAELGISQSGFVSHTKLCGRQKNEDGKRKQKHEPGGSSKRVCLGGCAKQPNPVDASELGDDGDNDVYDWCTYMKGSLGSVVPSPGHAEAVHQQVLEGMHSLRGQVERLQSQIDEDTWHGFTERSTHDHLKQVMKLQHRGQLHWCCKPTDQSNQSLSEELDSAVAGLRTSAEWQDLSQSIAGCVRAIGTVVAEVEAEEASTVKDAQDSLASADKSKAATEELQEQAKARLVALQAERAELLKALKQVDDKIACEQDTISALKKAHRQGNKRKVQLEQTFEESQDRQTMVKDEQQLLVGIDSYVQAVKLSLSRDVTCDQLLLDLLTKIQDVLGPADHAVRADATRHRLACVWLERLKAVPELYNSKVAELMKQTIQACLKIRDISAPAIVQAADLRPLNSGTVVVHSPPHVSHQVPDWHVESPARVSTAMLELKSLASRHPKEVQVIAMQHDPAMPLDDTMHRPIVSPEHLRTVIEIVHTPRYLKEIRDACNSLSKKEMKQLRKPGGDEDTYISRASMDAAKQAAATACHAMHLVLSGQFRSAFCCIRPPGHHVGREGAALGECSQGFCLLNNVCVAISHARMCFAQVTKFCVVDIDVHHGNGTEEICASDHETLFLSVHRHGSDFFPYSTGASIETSNCSNIGLDAGFGSTEFRTAISQFIDRINKFEPHVLVISAGFDAHENDAMGGSRLLEEDFFWATKQLVNAAEGLESCKGKVVSCLEGGYHVQSLASSIAAHVHALAKLDYVEADAEPAALAATGKPSKVSGEANKVKKEKKTVDKRASHKAKVPNCAKLCPEMKLNQSSVALLTKDEVLKFAGLLPSDGDTCPTCSASREAFKGESGFKSHCANCKRSRAPLAHRVIVSGLHVCARSESLDRIGGSLGMNQAEMHGFLTAKDQESMYYTNPVKQRFGEVQRCAIDWIDKQLCKLCGKHSSAVVALVICENCTTALHSTQPGRAWLTTQALISHTSMKTGDIFEGRKILGHDSECSQDNDKGANEQPLLKTANPASNVCIDSTGKAVIVHKFKCTWAGCNASFRDSSKLARHQVVHTRERPWICPAQGCGQRFSLKFNGELACASAF